ncbi:unnamed protein product [Linum tenue]|uniref:Uncharacterized protein n=1 Tax=Linum tenue TaxID=586396 RepID=A0AAV0NT82_9ROSI|nr:unnamed protein product [Linum tenue]
MGPARKRPATNHNGSAATRLTRSRTVLESGNNSEGDTTINNSSAQSQQNVNNVDQTPSEVQQVNMDEAHTGASKRNKRGKTKGYAVKRRLEEGNRIGGIIIEEGAKAPVGINEKLMKMEMGVVVRVLAPIRKFFWKEVTTEEKIPLFAKIEFKYNCHLHYKEETDPIKARENPMETLNNDDWKLLCDHFDGPAFKNNKEVQQDSTDNDVEQNNAAEEEPPELRVYSDTHKKRNGEWINPATKKNYVIFAYRDLVP